MHINWLDVIIVLLAIGALARGLELGLVRQLGSTVGFFGGLFLGAFFGTHLLKSSSMSATARVLVSFVLTFGTAMFLSSVGEYAGAALKIKISNQHILDKVDRAFGALLATVTILAGVWLSASFFSNMPSPTIQKLFKTSAIVAELNQDLPAAPSVIAKLGHALAPNGFPQVFAGLEPRIDTNTPLPSIGDLDTAVQKDRASVVKIQGQGCGGIVDGSGFVFANDLVATNAHVVAGVSDPEVIDGNGDHRTTVVFFDPNLDLAVLRTSGLKGQPLNIHSDAANNGTSATVLGYPGGGNFTADPAVVLDSFTAVGRNIYNEGETERQVYSVKADVEPGNSGGPLVSADGSVIGVVFAKSTSYTQVGYALTMQKVSQDLSQAKQLTTAVSTGNCAD